MKNKIIKILKENSEISDWMMERSDIYKDELYLIFDETESVRSVNTESYYVVIYVNKKIEGVDYTGTCSRSFLPGMDETEIKRQIDEAVFSASLALNPHFEISDNKENELEYNACDELFRSNRKQALEDIKESIYRRFAGEKEIKLSSAEIFLTYSKNLILTSRGVSYENEMTKIMLEVVMLAGSGEKEVESHLIRNERFLSVLDIDALLDRYITYAKENLAAVLPHSGKFKVIFTEEALDTFFEYYQSQLSGSMVYNKMAKFKIGDEIVKDVIGEKMNLSYDPSLPGGLSTMKYDGYGTLLNKFEIVKEGVVVKLACGKKYADYLNMECTGQATNLIVEPGQNSFEDLLEDGMFIFSRFSAFEPNSITGAFSGEVRNGLFYKDGKFIPVKGGSVTGIMDEVMKEAYFSKETIQKGNYFGPQYIKVSGVDITG